MCGISGLVLSSQTARGKRHPLIDLLDYSISQIQHRGYDGCGVAFIDQQSDTVKLIKEKGMIKPFFSSVKTNPLLNDPNLMTSIGIAHTRYKTVGPCTKTASQPLLNEDATICLAHNGQIDAVDHHPDSTYILNFINERLTQLAASNRSPEMMKNAIFCLVEQLFQTIEGSYSCVMLISGLGLVVFRDPKGIRPLVYGTNPNGDFIIASESVSITNLPDSYSFEIVRDVQPGECMIFNSGQAPISKLLLKESYHKSQFHSLPVFTPCIFEYIYLASPESIIDQLPVKEARRELGRLLAHHIQDNYHHLKIDLIVPIPESSCIATEVLAKELGVEYSHLLTLNTNRQKARSFILPTQEEREKAVAEKFIIPDNYDLQGRNILLVDDSIVRGTTLRHVIKHIRDQCINAGHIYVASISPPIKDKNSFGIDIPNTELLIAYQRNSEQVCQLLGADLVIYQDLDKMLKMFGQICPIADYFEHSMFIEAK